MEGRPRRRALKLTKRALDALRTDDPRGERFTDSEIAGFVVAVYPSGRKVFELRYGTRGRRRRIVLGAYGPLTVDQARALAREKLGEVAKGGDPAADAERKRAVPTWGEWVETYLAEIAARKRAPGEDRRYLGAMLESWGARSLDTIGTGDVARGYAGALERGRTTGNRWLASVKACLEAAWRRELVAENVARRVKPLPENAPRQRVLSEAELGRVLEIVEALPDPHVRAAFLVLIETGCRRSEILRARWDDVDLEAGAWTIPRAKSGRRESIPLSPRVVEILSSLPRLGPFVISGRAGGPRHDLKDDWHAVRLAARVPDVRIHDLRRTFGLAVAQSAGLLAAQKILRHSSPSVTANVYAPLGVEELRKVATTVSEERAAKVVEFRKRAKA